MERTETSGGPRKIVVDYCDQGLRHAPFQHLLTSSRTFDEVLGRLRQSIQVEDIMVLHEVDAQAILAKSNYSIGPARQILFFPSEADGTSPERRSIRPA